MLCHKPSARAALDTVVRASALGGTIHDLVVLAASNLDWLHAPWLEQTMNMAHCEGLVLLAGLLHGPAGRPRETVGCAAPVSIETCASPP